MYLLMERIEDYNDDCYVEINHLLYNDIDNAMIEMNNILKYFNKSRGSLHNAIFKDDGTLIVGSDDGFDRNVIPHSYFIENTNDKYILEVSIEEIDVCD